MSYEVGTSQVAAAAVVVEVASGRIVDETVIRSSVTFPYQPGLLAFREVPALLDALDALDHPGDLLLCDGQGVAHPRRCGLACHLGVTVGLPDPLRRADHISRQALRTHPA